MLKAENLNRRKAHIRISENVKKLNNSKRTLEDIFNITFSHENFTLFNIVKNGKVNDITYGEAKRNILRYATHFSKNIANSDKYVGLLMENSPEWVYSYYGLLMSGHSPVLLSTAASDEETKDVLKEIGCFVLVSNRNLLSKTINPFEINEEEPLKEYKWANETIFITSGTSGKSKIYSYTGEELSEQLLAIKTFEKDRPAFLSFYKKHIKQLLVLPLYHIFGFSAGFLWFTFFNVTIVLPESLAPLHVREAAIAAEPTHLLAVPMFWDYIAKNVSLKVKEKGGEKKFNKALKVSYNIQKRHPKRGSRIVKGALFKRYIDQILGKSLQFCITGGTAISPDTLALINNLGYPLVNGYGSTELGIVSFVNPKNIKTRNTLSIGEPFKICTFTKDSNDELCVLTKSGYHAMLVDGKFVARDKSEPIRTADVCEIEFDKYFIKGRLDEIFVAKNGENYSLVRIENELKSDYAKDTVCVEFDGSICLVLSYDKLLPHEIIKRDLSKIIHDENFSKYAIRKVYLTTNELPKANGIKVKRNKIVEMLKTGELLSMDISFGSELNEKVEYNPVILNEVISIFEELSNCKDVKLDSDFFIDLGGDSLEYFDLITKLESHFNVGLEINIQVTRTPLQFTLEAMKHLPANYGKKEEKSEKSPEKTGKFHTFNIFRFVARAFIKVSGILPFYIFVSPRHFYASKKAKKESRNLKGGAILVGNHTSTFDYITYIYKHFFRVVHTFVGPAIYRFRSLRHLCNVLENIEVKKNDPANVDALKKAKQYLEHNKTIAIFPEGRFEDNLGEIEPFSSSAIRLAFATKKPIIPHYFKGNYGLFKRAKINVGEKIYVHELVKKDELSNEDIQYVTEYLRSTIKKLKHQLKSFEVHKTQSRFSWKLFISDLFKLTGFPFGYLVFWARKIYIGDKKKVRKAMKEKVILSPTHTSFFDVVFMYLYFVSRRLRIFALKEAVSGKLLHKLTQGAGVIEYDRDAKGGFDLKSFKETDEILEGNGCVVMFPQGHIVDDGKLEGNDLKQGIALHSLRRNVPIIPIVFGKETRPIRFNKIYIGDPIYPADYVDVVEATKENIEKFTELIQTKMLELQSISQKRVKKVKEE